MNTNFKSAHNSWEPEENLTDDLIQEFNSNPPKRKSRTRVSTTGSSSIISLKEDAENIKPSSTMSTFVSYASTSNTALKLPLTKPENDREPDKIIGAKQDDKTGEIMLLFKWKDSMDADLSKI